MILPFATDRALRRPTLVTIALIAVNVAIAAVYQLADTFQWDRVLASWGDLLLTRDHAWSHRLVTYAFLHAGLLHLLGNMLFLWTFGPNLEDRLGRIGFLAFYLAGAAAAGALHIWIDRAPVVGASGAIAAVTGACMVLFPRTNIKALFLLGFGIFTVPAIWIIGTQIIWDVLLRGFSPGSPVARLAHLGGYAFGIAVALALLWLRVLPREPFDLFTIGKQAVRRRAFREIEYQRQRAAEQRPTSQQENGSLAQARATVQEALATHRREDAAKAYVSLLASHGRAAALLSPASQRDVANELFRLEDYANAATAYELYVEHYERENDIADARLMLGLINARYLNDPVRAKRELNAAMAKLVEPGQRELAASLLADLG